MTTNQATNPDVNVDEYYFDVDDIKNPIDDNCLNCDKKFTNEHSVAFCRSCLQDFTINQTTAIKDYNLKKNDLDDIDCYSYKNRFGTYTNYYILKEIRLIAINARFDLAYPNIDQYTKCITVILDESQERDKKRKERGLKMMATRARNAKLKIDQQNEAYEHRVNILKNALGEKNLTVDTDCVACNEYLEGECTDLTYVVKEMQDFSDRTSKLIAALSEKNLVIRHDSYCCRKYLMGENFSLGEVVEIMEIMNFFATKTSYFNFCENHIQQKYTNAKDCGYWDGEKIFLNERDKDIIKSLALKTYLEKNSADDVPRCVLQLYSSN